MKDTPHRLAEWLLVVMFRRDRPVRSLRADVHDALALSVAGDLAEVFYHRCATEGRFRAHCWYWGQVVRAVFPFFAFQLHIANGMLQSYLRSALRHFRKTFWFTTINVSGLAIGLSISVIALLFVRHEYGYDRFHSDADRLYRVGLTAFFQDLTAFESTPHVLVSELAATVPGIERATSYTQMTNMMVRHGEQLIQRDIHAMGPSFFDLFHFPVQTGSDAAVLSEQGTMLISHAEASRLFPDQNAIGQQIDVELVPGEWNSFEIRGILAPPEGPTNLTFDIVISDTHLPAIFGEDVFESWDLQARHATLVKLAPGVSATSLVEPMNALATRHGLDRYSEEGNPDVLLPMERLREAHLGTVIPNRILAAQGDPEQIRLLVIVALLLLLVAAVNYVNLTIGLSLRRAREVGVRKVFGAVRQQIARQHLFENLLLVLVSLGLSIGLAAMLLPFFNQFTGTHLELASLFEPETLLILAAFVVLTGLLSSAYPVLLLASFRPSAVFRSGLGSNSRSWLSRGMIGFQFVVSMTLVASTLMISAQMEHVRSRPLGFESEHVVVQIIPRLAAPELVDRYRQALAPSPGILGVSGARTTLLGDGYDSALRVEMQGEGFTLAAGKIDDHYLDVMGLDLVAGRNLDRPGDLVSNRHVLVNEAFVEGFGLENAVGAPTPFYIDREGPATIVGVVADYHFQSLRRDIEPILLYPRPESHVRQILTRVDGQSIPRALEDMRDAWQQVAPGLAFDPQFLDDFIAGQYEAELKLRRLGGLAALIVVFVALVGLIGITALSITRRTREIGVRKVLGANEGRLVALFNMEYAGIALVASLVSLGISWIMMNRWLDSFAFRIDVSPLILIGSSLSVILLAASVVSVLSLRASRMNPVAVLRHE